MRHGEDVRGRVGQPVASDGAASVRRSSRVPMQHPYQVMPCLSSKEYAALKADIEANGVQVPVDVDEQDNTLDGFHRRRISEELGIECPQRELTGLTEAQKREHAWRMNLTRRHLSQAQKREIAGSLRREGWTQERIAQALGSSQPTVSRWLARFIQMDKLPQPGTIQGKDGRAYPPTKARQPVRRQTEGGDTTERVSPSPTHSYPSKGIRQQNAVPASRIDPEGPPLEGAGVAPAATDPPGAAFAGNGISPAEELGTPVSLYGSVSVPFVQNDGEQFWVTTLEALSAHVQGLQAQGSVPPLSVLRNAETRTRCLATIRRMKKVFAKWEKMIAHAVEEAASSAQALFDFN